MKKTKHLYFVLVDMTTQETPDAEVTKTKEDILRSLDISEEYFVQTFYQRFSNKGTNDPDELIEDLDYFFFNPFQEEDLRQTWLADGVDDVDDDDDATVQKLIQESLLQNGGNLGLPEPTEEIEGYPEGDFTAVVFFTEEAYFDECVSAALDYGFETVGVDYEFCYLPYVSYVELQKTMMQPRQIRRKKQKRKKRKN